MSLLSQLEETAVGTWIRESEWGYPIVLICHTVGMACLVGGAFAFAIRVLMTRAQTSLAWFATIFRIACLGFAINLASGLILFAGAAQRYVGNPAFQSKMAALIAGAIALRVLARRTTQETASVSTTRLIAAVTLACFIAAIGAGRLMAYIR